MLHHNRPSFPRGKLWVAYVTPCCYLPCVILWHVRTLFADQDIGDVHQAARGACKGHACHNACTAAVSEAGTPLKGVHNMAQIPFMTASTGPRAARAGSCYPGCCFWGPFMKEHELQRIHPSFLCVTVGGTCPHSEAGAAGYQAGLIQDTTGAGSCEGAQPRASNRELAAEHAAWLASVSHAATRHVPQPLIGVPGHSWSRAVQPMTHHFSHTTNAHSAEH